MAAIDVDQITKRFGEFTAVDGVSFQVATGEIFGLLGPNGAGKSTLIRMLTTLIEPTSGTARINDFDIREAPNDVRKCIGVIPQASTADLDLSLDENLMIFAKLYGVPRERRKRDVKELLDAVDLGAWADKPVKFLSGGMRRRLEIARGLVHKPRIFFLDEPTTGLDPVSRVAVWEMLTHLQQERELTILITTHYMDEADKLADRVAIVDHGKLVALDTPFNLKASMPGESILEVSFSSEPPDWLETVEHLPEVVSVKKHDHLYRISSRNGPRTTVELVETARARSVTVTALSVQSATLDDVFMHFTGRQLRDELQAPAPSESPFMLRR
jgi:ABC-2 type transport system ATP-binding protein